MTATARSRPPNPDLPEVSHSLMERSPVPMAELEGAEQVVRYVNPAFCRLVGKSKEALVGSPFAETAQEGDGCVAVLDRVYRTGEAETHTESEHPGLHPAYWSFAMWPVLDADQTPVGVMMQVTETTRFHQQAGAMNEALLISSVRQHELTDAAEALNEQLQAEITERKRHQEEREKLAAIVEASDDSIISTDLKSIVITWNRGAERLFGYTPDEVIGKSVTILLPKDRSDEESEILARIRRGERVEHFETIRRRKHGSFINVSLTVSPIKNSAGKIIGVSKVARDITERRQHEEHQKRLLNELTQAELQLQQANENLEQRVADEVEQRRQTEDTLRQAQKMDAIGQLTGGIAHDFNNLLTIITGNIEILERHLPEDNLWRKYITAALLGSSRAALLTNRLLAFSRRQPLAPQVVSANRLVAGVEDLLRRTLGEQISIEAVLAGGLWPASVDLIQFENTLINLAVNARDAMPDGGKLTIETANCDLDDAYAAINRDVPPGQYVGIFVTDTGTGMSPEVVAQAFEPFYTTKETGQGTGLGLSQVYGFIKQSEGHIKIDSDVGRGTTVRIYLPRHRGAATEEVQDAETAVPQGKGETVLVVEDDPDVRNYAIEVLHHLGYRALAAEDGASAISLLNAHPEVSLLFTDVVLPGGTNGRQLSDAALFRHPHLKVLYTTGHTRDAIIHQGRLDQGIEVIFKPYRYSEIAAKLRQVLDGSRGGGGGGG